MTFRELLKAKDAAATHAQECAAALEAATASLAAAQSAHDEAEAARLAAHKAIADRLAERGHYSLVDDAGTVTVYQADPSVETGWKSYHPIPGDE